MASLVMHLAEDRARQLISRPGLTYASADLMCLAKICFQGVFSFVRRGALLMTSFLKSLKRSIFGALSPSFRLFCQSGPESFPWGFRE